MEKQPARKFDVRNLWGGLIVFFGLVFLLQELGIDIRAADFWPIFLLAPGLTFWYLYFSQPREGGREGLVIPGTILSLLGCLFIFESVSDWRYSDQTAFAYTLIISLAFFAAYRFGARARGYLVPAWILFVVSGIIFFSNNVRFNAWPFIFIAIGLWLLWQRKPQTDTAVFKKTDQQ